MKRGMRFLFVMDPAETMTSDKDTTFAFLRGARALGHSSWHCLPQQVSLRGADGFATARPIAVSDTAPHVELGAPERLELAALDAIFIRKDPPFDAGLPVPHAAARSRERSRVGRQRPARHP